MINAAFITRSTLHTVPGGDTIQIQQTAKWLGKLGVNVKIHLTHEIIDYAKYDLFHFFNLNRPADIMLHLFRIQKPVFISPVMVDYSEYDRNHRHGLPGFIMRRFSPATNEYLKTISRWIRGNDQLPSRDYLWIGHKSSIRQILKKATLILPNSAMEMKSIESAFGVKKPFLIIPNGIDQTLFIPEEKVVRDDKLVLCVARIEGIKNQLNLIKAVNGTEFTLMLIGSPAPNQGQYYEACKTIAGKNIIFMEQMSQEKLLLYYNKAKVHVLPSWFETCGLSSLEAAAMGCNIVITDKGFTREYFGNNARYCDPGSPSSILQAIEAASSKEVDVDFRNRILAEYTWEQAAIKTKKAYES